MYGCRSSDVFSGSIYLHQYIKNRVYENFNCRCHSEICVALPSQPASSSRALLFHLHFDNCSDVFCFIIFFSCAPTNLLMAIAIDSTVASSKISSFLRCSGRPSLAYLLPGHKSYIVENVSLKLSKCKRKGCKKPKP